MFTGPDHCGAGNDYLMMLLCAIIGTHHKVALENPTYKQAYRLFENLSCEVCTVDMDAKGMRADELEKSGADIAFVMPSHQYPLGTVMPIKRRMELLAWADESEDRYIIEDDYDSEFRYKGKPIPALQGYDGNGESHLYRDFLQIDRTGNPHELSCPSGKTLQSL